MAFGTEMSTSNGNPHRNKLQIFLQPLRMEGQLRLQRALRRLHTYYFSFPQTRTECEDPNAPGGKGASGGGGVDPGSSIDAQRHNLSPRPPGHGVRRQQASGASSRIGTIWGDVRAQQTHERWHGTDRARRRVQTVHEASRARTVQRRDVDSVQSVCGRGGMSGMTAHRASASV